ncbi:YqjF family protein [Arthrobacter sp. ov118]|uniref:YqjF family protein n=1 Tax=Arthrobacter sp. ov118 TaxID=1761747 RepID=UPI0008E240A6|nr:DUF2071 domain-containing protein [Arthrobacter sp. ov118]SFT95217.1 hypothetical protein SAMN04487915_10675 [Arthrobacter sp. ov118]
MQLDPWPEAPDLPAPVIMDQRWIHAVFLHWRIPEPVAASFMPRGVVPDNFDGSAWVGLIGFRMRDAGLGRGPGVPYFGSFIEVNVRLYSREPDGTRGVVFLTLDASRLAPVLAARAAGIPYVWSRTSFVGDGELPGLVRPRVVGPSVVRPDAVPPSAGFSVRRFRGGARSDFTVGPEFDVEATDPLSIHLTARFGLHSRFRGKTVYIPNAHSAWPLYPAHLIHLDDQLISAAGIEIAGPPESVLFSPGVHTQFGRPRVLHSAH